MSRMIPFWCGIGSGGIGTAIFIWGLPIPRAGADELITPSDVDFDALCGGLEHSPKPMACMPRVRPAIVEVRTQANMIVDGIAVHPYGTQVNDKPPNLSGPEHNKEI